MQHLDKSYSSKTESVLWKLAKNIANRTRPHHTATSRKYEPAVKCGKCSRVAVGEGRFCDSWKCCTGREASLLGTYGRKSRTTCEALIGPTRAFLRCTDSRSQPGAHRPLWGALLCRPFSSRSLSTSLHPSPASAQRPPPRCCIGGCRDAASSYLAVLSSPSTALGAGEYLPVEADGKGWPR